MAEDRISDLFDEAAILKQFNSILDKTVGKLGGLSKLKVQVEGASSVKEFTLAQAKMAEEMRAVESLAKQRFATDAKLITLQTDYARATANNRVEIQRTNKELKAQAEAEQAVIGSRDRAKAQIKILTAAKDKLNLTNATEKKAYDDLVAKIERYDAFLKKTGTTAEKQRANIGNYAGSLAKPFESLQNKLNEIRNQLSKGIGFNGQKDQESIRQTEGIVESLEKALDKASAKGASATAQVKALENAYQTISFSNTSLTPGSSQHTETSGFLNGFKKEVAEAKDAVQDLKDEIKINASDTQGIDNVVSSLNVLAGVAQGAAGAYALFGGSEEEAAKVTAKLMAIQGIANSVQQVGAELTRRGSAANKIYALVQGLVATATDRSAAATARLAAATKLLIGGGILIAVALIVTNYEKIKNALSNISDEQRQLNSIKEEAIKNYTEENTKVGLLVKEYQNLATTTKRRKEIQDDLQKDYPAYFGNLKTEKEFAEQIAVAYGKLSQALLLNAQISAATKILSDNEEKALLKELEAQQITDKRAGADIFGSLVGKRRASLVKKMKDDKLAEAAALRESNKFIIDAIMANQKELDKLGGDPNKPADSPKKAKISTGKTKINDNTEEDILRSQFEISKQRLQIELDYNKEVIADDQRSYEERFTALNEYNMNAQKLIGLQTQFEIDQETIKTKKIIQGLEDQKNVKGANVQAINTQIEKESNASALRLRVIEGNNFQARVDLSKDYAEKLVGISVKRESDLQIHGADAAKKYLDDAKSVEEQILKIKQDSAEKQKELQRGLQDQLLDAFTSFLTSSIDKETESLTRRQEAIKADTDKKIEEINSLGLAEEERARRIAIAQKQSLFETEQIEKKKTLLAKERKKVEKAADVANIIGQTARTVFDLAAKVAQAKAQAALLLSNPLTAAYAPVATAAAASIAIQIPLVIAGGALQIAKIAAFKTGTQNAPKGPAWVGEEGTELVVPTSGTPYLTPSVPTLTQLAGGEKIFPADVTQSILNSTNLQHLIGMKIQENKPVSSSAVNEYLTRKMLSELQSLNRKSRIIINNKHGIETSAWYHNQIKN